MKGQIPGEISAIIVGALLIWIGTVFLGIPSTSPLTASFGLYVGGGFILAGIVSIAGGALSLMHL
jgi:dipeptide/tripeptide permease